MAVAARAVAIEQRSTPSSAQPARPRGKPSPPRARTAPQRGRRIKARLARRHAFTSALLAAPLVIAFGYVWLTAELTAQTYRLHDALAAQTRLLQDDAQLRREASSLQSLPRLQAAAAKLHMTVPAGVALIAPERAAAQSDRTTVFAASLAGLRRIFSAR